MKENNTPPAAIIAGIDEAGRGPLAGPVVAAACILPFSVAQIDHGRWKCIVASHSSDEHPTSCIIGDSKQLSTADRETAYVMLTQHCAWGTGATDAAIIDRIGILEATQRAMQHAVANLSTHSTPTYLLVDGRDKFWFDLPHSSIIRGDSLEPAIAAASIIAKVTRDRMMMEADAQFPAYGFARHKGYGTPEHLAAIAHHGYTKMHRKTFRLDGKVY